MGRYWVDAVSFGAAENGVSFGRYPDFTGPLVTLARPTFGSEVDATFPPQFLANFRTGLGASNALPKVGPLVVSQIMYHPLTNADEFIEVRNISGASVALSDPLYPTNTWRFREAIDFDFPSGTALAAGEKALVVPIAPAAFRAKYPVAAAVQIFGPYTNALNNAGDSLRLFKPDPPQQPPHPDAGFVPYILVEQVGYRPTAPWPAAADGTGVALQRLDPAGYGDDPANWTAEAIAAPPQVTAALAADGRLRVSFIAAAGLAYVVEGRPEAGSGTWATLVTIPASAVSVGVAQDLATSGARQFVRVQVQ